MKIDHPYIKSSYKPDFPFELLIKKTEDNPKK